MSKNTSVSLGTHFDDFVQSCVNGGRYKNASEVIRAGLRLLEEEEAKIVSLQRAISKGTNSPKVHNFNFDDHLKTIKGKPKK